MEKNNKEKVVITIKDKAKNTNTFKKPTKPKPKKNRGKGKGKGKKISLMEYYAARVNAPGMFGPFQQPRAGSASRTNLAMDQSEYTITGSATSVVQGIYLQTQYNGGSPAYVAFVVAANTTILPLTSVVSVPVGSQFPPVASVADINLVACDIVAYYTGNPLNVQGEVIFNCSVPLVQGSTTYNNLYYMAGTLKVPVADLIQTPLRVSGRKLSPIADEFVPPGNSNADYDVPYVITSGLPAGGTLNLLVTRIWEYRSTTFGSVVPYEIAGESFTSDVSAFQDAKQAIGSAPNTVNNAYPSASGDQMLKGLGFCSMGGAAAAAYAANRIRTNHQNGIVSGMQDAFENTGLYQYYANMSDR